MINEPSVDELVRKLGSEEEPISRYELISLASALMAVTSGPSLRPPR